ncbi:MAG: HlyC/CorC family transporter [Piscirickettsiaceae bacterium]|nr:HlyC/CorC family transporter [Piscirickettsiaceae bacterium]
MLEGTSLLLLFVILFILLLFSAFFSGSETALMSLNRYRLRHLEHEGHTGAILASQLLTRPDRLIGLILLGNNFTNIFASAIATIIGIKLFGENGIVISTVTLTVIVLLFAEVTPKTLAALNPERVAFSASFILKPLFVLLYPAVWFINAITNRILSVFGVSPGDVTSSAINSEELRMALIEAGSIIPKGHKKMLVGILDLEKVTVNDVMVLRTEIEGLDINASIIEISKKFSHCSYTNLPVYNDNLNNIIGILYVRKVMYLLAQDNLTRETLNNIIRNSYFVPEGTPLNIQLIQFQRQRRRMSLVVNEYGDVVGLVTLEDILQEIVGEFTSDSFDEDRDIHPQQDGSYLISGTANIRDINRSNRWHLPTKDPKTINGLILEVLEIIPDPGVSLRVEDYIIEIVQTLGNTIQTVRISEDES